MSETDDSRHVHAQTTRTEHAIQSEEELIELIKSGRLEGRSFMLSAPCECRRCREQWRTVSDQDPSLQVKGPLTYSGTMTLDVVEQRLSLIRSRMQQDRSRLRSVLDTHGDTILKYWRKMSKEERSLTLKQVMPEIASRKWEKEETLRFSVQMQERAELRTQLQLPYMSYEDLSTDYQRLMFLAYLRATYEPSEYVQIDKTQTAFAWYYPVVDVWHAFQDGVVSMKAQDYAQLRYYSHEKQQDRDAIHRWEKCGIPRAGLLIEAQGKLLTMLRGACEGLAQHGKASGNARFLKRIGMGLRQDGIVELTSPYLDQPFSKPPTMDIYRLIETATVRLNVAKDDLWLLQTHMPYMDDWLTAEVRVPESSAATKKLRGLTTHAQLYRDVCSLLFDHKILLAAQWQHVVEQCQATAAVLAEQTSDTFYETSLQELDDTLTHLLLVKLSHSWNIVGKMPEFSRYFPVSFDNDRVSVDLGHRDSLEISMRTMFNEDPMLYALMQLICVSQGGLDEYRLESIDFDISRSMGILEYFLSHRGDDGPEDRKVRKFDNSTLSWLADLIAVHEMLINLRSRKPAYRLSDKCWMPVNYRGQARGRLIINVPLEDLTRIAELMRAYRKMPHPSGERNLHWLRCRDARLEALNKMWSSIRELFGRENLETKDAKLVKLAAKMFGASNDPAHLKMLNEEKASILLRLQEQDLKVEIQTEWGSTPDKDKHTPSSKKHSKRSAALQQLPSDVERLRLGDDHNAQIISTSDAPEEQTTSTPPIVSVLKDSLRTLQRLYPAPQGIVLKTGLIAWTAFAKAMVDAGFEATHTGGSAVTLRTNEGSISIHRPHPDPKLDNVMLHIIGKRMNRHFGWTYDSFCERVKDGAAPVVGDSV